MARVGYARVSSVGQSLEVQLDRLSDCDRVFHEKRSGTSDNRPVLQECLRYLRSGDTLVVTKLDRLARSTFHLCSIVERLREEGVEFEVLDQAIDTSTSTGRLTLNVLSVIAQFETEIRAERQMDGIAKAKERGVRLGKKSALDEEQVKLLKQMRADGFLITELMKKFGVSKVTVYRYLNDGYRKVAA